LEGVAELSYVAFCCSEELCGGFYPLIVSFTGSRWDFETFLEEVFMVLSSELGAKLN